MRQFFWMILPGILLSLMMPCHAAERDIPYGPDPSQRLDICTPSDFGATPHRPMPALLMIHGGGWVAGSRQAQAGLCTQFARAGLVTIPMDYRLYDRTVQTAWPAQFNDAQLAMRWVRSHAASLGIDPSHICAEGGSSGAQLALLLGVVTTIDPGDTSSLLPGVSPQADCAISVSGIGDEVAYAQTIGVVPRVLIGPAGAPASSIAAIEASASPALRVHPGAPPTLIIHGLQDDKVLFAQAVSMQAALARAGTPAWLVSYRGGHMLTGLDAAQSNGVWALVQSFALTERLAGPPRQMSLADALNQLQ